MKYLSLFALLALAPLTALAEDATTYNLTIKDHQFSPNELTVPAGKKIKLIVDNQDPSAEEFESHELKREKIIPGKTKATVMVGPLKPGTYSFVGEFNEATAKGKLIAK